MLPLIDVERSIRAEQLRLLFKSPISLAGSALAVAVSLTVLWDSVPASLLLAWSGAILLWLGVRGVMWLRFRREEADDAQVVRWARPAVVMMSGSGLLWGAFGAGFYLPEDPELSAFVILIIASMVVGGTFAYAAYLPAFNAFVITTIGPLAASSFLHSTATSVIFGATTAVNLALMLSMGRSVNRSIVGMIRLKFANADLVSNLRQAKDAAEVASRVKSEFLATMSHELRTPLNAVLGFAEMIRDARSGPVDAKYRAYAADIHSSGEHLLALISDILDISKIEAGRLELHEERISMGMLAGRCLRLIAPRTEEAGIAVRVSVPADLPMVLADEMRLKQAMLNLLSNAVKFTPPGGRIEIAAALSEDGGIETTIADTGIGMRPEDIPVALEPFRQIDSKITRNYGGTGLGLPLARRLMELHGGYLRIASAVGLGTTVTMGLPSTRVAAEAERRAAVRR